MRTDRRFQTRTLAVLTGFVCVLSLLSWRLIYVQHECHDYYRDLVLSLHRKNLLLASARGRVLDRDGQVLACNRPVFKVVADRFHLRDPRVYLRGAAAVEGIPEHDLARVYPGDEIRRRYLRHVVQTLGPALGMHPESLAGKIERSDVGEAVLAQRIDSDLAAQLRSLIQASRIRGVRLRESSERYYPSPNRLTHVLGYTDIDGDGQAGIERAMDAVLQGRDGQREVEFDALDRELPAFRGEVVLPVDGHNVRLAIDMRLQDVVESALEERGSDDGEVYVPDLRAEKVSVVLMQPHTGEVLAMASRPDFDLATRDGNRRNPAVYDTYEPGSTFKIVTYAGILESGLVSLATQVNCQGGTLIENGVTLRDAHGYGVLSVKDCFLKSSNIAAYKLAKQLGRRRFSEYVARFGFGSPTGIEIPDEATGLVTPVERWSAPSFSRMAMGYEVSVTPLQMAVAVCAVANGGELLVPRLVLSVEDGSGQAVSTSGRRVRHRVFSEATAARLREMMVAVTAPGGTGTRAAIPGYSVAGKTGTAQKYDPRRGRYLSGRYVVSFVGFLPADDPKLAAVVVIDNPAPEAVPGPVYGGTVAAPVFRRIAARAAECLGVAPGQGLEFAGSAR